MKFSTDFTKMNKKQMREAIEQWHLQWEEAEVKGAFIGFTGTGKSSLINAFAGEKIAEVSALGQCTMAEELTTYDLEGMVIADLPGVGTQEYPVQSYIKDMNLLDYDFCIMVIGSRITADEVEVYKMLTKEYNKKIYLVRTRFDEVLRGASEEEARLYFKKYFFDNFGTEEFYCVSSFYPEKYDFVQLQKDLLKNQTGFKKKKLLAQLSTNCDEILVEKAGLAKEVVVRYSWLSAANGFNPIVGLDFAADIGLLMRMGHEVQKIFNLDERSLTYLKSLGMPVEAAGVLKGMAKFLTEKGVIMLLKRFSVAVGTKSLLKFLPGIGNLISAGVGYKITMSYGKNTLEEMRETAREVMQANIKGVCA